MSDAALFETPEVMPDLQKRFFEVVHEWIVRESGPWWNQQESESSSKIFITKILEIHQTEKSIG